MDHTSATQPLSILLISFFHPDFHQHDSWKLNTIKIKRPPVIEKIHTQPNYNQYQSTQIATQPTQKQLFANPAPNPMPGDAITAQIDEMTGNRYKLVFVGFSGLGYDNPKAVRELAAKILDRAISEHPEGVALVIGATTAGIGDIYSMVKENAHYCDVKCVGIVSEVVKNMCPDDLSDACKDSTIFVPDPNKTWQVLNEGGTHSYTAYAAEKNGDMYALGGGLVAIEEVKMAMEQGVSPYVFDFKANENNVLAKESQGKSRDTLMPMAKTFW